MNKKNLLFLFLLMTIPGISFAANFHGTWHFDAKAAAKKFRKVFFKRLKSTEKGRALLKSKRGRALIQSRLSLMEKINGKIILTKDSKVDGWMSLPGKKKEPFRGTFQSKKGKIIMKVLKVRKNKWDIIICQHLAANKRLQCVEKKKRFEFIFNRQPTKKAAK